MPLKIREVIFIILTFLEHQLAIINIGGALGE